MLRVTPVYGSRFSEVGEAEEPVCTLIEFSGCRCLVNVGWNEELPDLPDHDCLLLTDSTIQTIGALPVYYEQMKAKRKARQMKMEDVNAMQIDTMNEVPPIYATFPTVKMGQMTLYDQHSAICMDGGRPPFSLQSVDDAFASIRAIKYSQHINVAVLGQTKPALSVTAHRAGHVVGGAFYVLQRLQDETVVVITEATYHIAKELHLDSSTLLKHAATPDVLITRPGGPAFRQLKALSSLPSVLVSQAEQNLTETILSVLRRDGNVLLPVDASGRILELILLLNQQWEKQRLQAAYNLVWFAPMCHNVTEFVRSQLEWMGAKLGAQFDSGSGHPYQLRAVRFATSMSELNLIIDENQNPTCVLASGLSLEGGPSRDVFVKWKDNADNAIVFTDSSMCYLRRSESSGTAASIVPIIKQEPDADVEGQDNEETDILVGDTLTEFTRSPWTTAGQLMQAWAKAKAEGAEMEDSIMVDVNVPVKAPLSGEELKNFLAKEEAARLALKRAEEKRAMLAQVELAKGQLHLGEEETEAPKATSRTVSRPRKKSRFDSTLFLKFSKPLYLTFEVREEAVGIGQDDSIAKYGIGESVGRSGEILEDDYGISVQHDRFTDIVSGVDPSKFAGGSGRIGDEVLRRGFGYGVDSAGRATTTSANKGTAKFVSEDEDNDERDDMNEQAMEAVDLSEGNGIIRGRNGRPPTKVSTVPRKVEVLAEVSYIPGLEGRVDAKAARQSVRALQPREVIVLGGIRGDLPLDKSAPLVTDEVANLAEAAKSYATGSKNILTPVDGQPVELAIGHAAFGVRLIDTPYMTQSEKEALDTPPKPVEPFEAKLGACTVSLVDCVATGQKVAADDSIVLAPRSHQETENQPSVYLSDGEVLLTDLRAELTASGMKAEYTAHADYSQLLVNGKILVKKERKGQGRMHVEGPLCEDFYTVRAMVCAQYVVL